MCDEFTAAEQAAALARKGLSRREFAAIGAAAALAGCAGTGKAAAGESLSEKMVSITTPDGVADAFFVHPAKTKAPGILMWPDIAGLREAKKIMARGIAAQGYAVLCVNPYYRAGPAPIFDSFSDYATPEGQAKVKPMREALTPAAVMSDARAHVSFLDGSGVVDTARGIGSNGYCMGGPFTVRSAVAVPDRVRAAASLHGAGLVTDAPDSPHRELGKTKASFLFAIARGDDKRQPDAKTELRKAADAAGRPAEVEVYPAEHGWCVPDSPAWDPTQADKAWHRMMALFEKL